MSVPTAPTSKSRRFRFGLRSGVVSIAIIGVLLGLVDFVIRDPYRSEQRAATKLERSGGYVLLIDDTQSFIAKYFNFGLIDMRIAAIVDLGHSRVTDADLIHLRAFHHFGTLSLAETAIDDAGIAELRHVVGERFIDLSRTKVTDTSPFFLGRTFSDSPLGMRLSGNRVAGGKIFPERLNVYCSLHELDLSETDADDRTLEAFPTGLVISKLDLSGTRITDAGLESLSKLDNLSSLDLSNTKVTPEGIARLKAVWKGSRPLTVLIGSKKALIPPYVSDRPKK